MSSTIGAFEQLGLLADYAADIFKDLIETSTDLHARIVTVHARAHTLAEQIPEAISFVDGSRVFLGSIDKAPAERIREQTPQAHLLDHSSMPKILLAQYQSREVHSIPDFKQLDSLVKSNEDLQDMGGSLAMKYSNPHYVREEWIKKKELENLELEKVKEARKVERKAKRAKKAESLAASGTYVEKKKTFTWKDRFDRYRIYVVMGYCMLISFLYE